MTLDASGRLGIGTATPPSKLSVVTTTATGSTVSAWSTGHVLISPDAGSTTGAALGLGYNTSADVSEILSLAPSLAWKPLVLLGAGIRLNATNGVESMRIDASGNVAIGLTSTTYKLQVNGSFAATTKSFVIDHPTKPNMKLRYGSLEGPENGVYVRGRLNGDTIIELPEYWTKLVDEDSITVNLTPIGSHQKLYVKDIVNNTVVVGNENLFGNIDCFYTVWAERKDVDKLEVEI